jgi:hypothetical protein
MTLQKASTAGSFVGARAYNNGTQSVNDSTATALTLDSEEFDTDGFHSTSSNTSRMTIPSGKAGKYLIRGHTSVNANATGDRIIVLRKNGADVTGSGNSITASAQIIRQEVVAIVDLVAADYIELFVFQGSGGARIYGAATAGDSTTLEIALLASTPPGSPPAPQRVVIGSNDVTIASTTIATVHSSLDITFTAPSSGRVMFVGGGVVKATALSDVIFFIQLDSGSDNPMGAHEFDASAVPVSIPIGYVHTGLTPGQSYVAHYRWRRDGTGTLSITAGARGGAQQGTWWMCIPLP